VSCITWLRHRNQHDALPYIACAVE